LLRERSPTGCRRDERRPVRYRPGGNRTWQHDQLIRQDRVPDRFRGEWKAVGCDCVLLPGLVLNRRPDSGRGSRCESQEQSTQIRCVDNFSTTAKNAQGWRASGWQVGIDAGRGAAASRGRDEVGHAAVSRYVPPCGSERGRMTACVSIFGSPRGEPNATTTRPTPQQMCGRLWTQAR